MNVTGVVVTSPEFRGPVFVSRDTFTDYYFTCRLSVDAASRTEFDVRLTFDGDVDHSLPLKTATASSPEIIFRSADFGQHFGQQVTQSRLTEYRTPRGLGSCRLSPSGRV